MESHKIRITLKHHLFLAAKEFHLHSHNQFPKWAERFLEEVWRNGIRIVRQNNILSSHYPRETQTVPPLWPEPGEKWRVSLWGGSRVRDITGRPNATSGFSQTRLELKWKSTSHQCAHFLSLTEHSCSEREQCTLPALSENALGLTW